MLKDVLTILFYATSVYVVLWITYKLGHKEGYREGYAKGRAEGYDDGRRYEAITEHNREQLEKMIAGHEYNIKKD